MQRITLLLVFSVSAVNAAEVTRDLQNGRNGYVGTQDVTISADGNLETQNFGGAHQIDIWQFDGVAVLRFELSAFPKNAVVKAASLDLYCASVGFSPEEIARAWPVSVYACTQSWKEGTGIPKEKPRKDGATLKTSDGTHRWPEGGVTAVAGDLLSTTTLAGDQQRWYRWDLNPEIVQGWINGSRPNYGVMIWGKSPGKAVSFTSKDSTAADRRPILHLTLSVPDADAGSIAGGIRWTQFVADCGKKAQEANEARTEQVFEERYLDKVVNWSGTVHSASRKLIGSGYQVLVRMDPTESAFGAYDLSLSGLENMKDSILSLNKGQRVNFSARFIRQGGTILGHELQLLSIEQVKPKR